MARRLRKNVLAHASSVPAKDPALQSELALPRRTFMLMALAIGALALLAYSNSFKAALTLDNKALIAQAPQIREVSWQNLKIIFTENYWWPTISNDLYRPITTLSYLFNYSVLGNGPNPAGYHWVNFLLHWANACLVLVIIRRLTGRTRLALIAAAIFAVHPVAVESVTNIVGRADLLAMLSILLGGYCYIRAAAAQGGKRRWLAAAGAVACLGVFAKESAVMITAFVLLYDVLFRWPKLQGNWRARLGTAAREFGLKGYIAFLPAVVLIFTAHYWIVKYSLQPAQVFVDNPIAYAGPFQGFMTAMKVIGRYLGLLVFPRTLSCDYSYNQIPLYGESPHLWQDMQSWVSVIVVGGILWSAVRWRGRSPAYALGVGVFFLMLLPTSNLIVPIGSIMAERFLYAPLMGFCIVAALALEPMSRALARLLVRDAKWRDHAALVLPAAVIVAFGMRTYVRNNDWKDDLSLFKSAVAASPDSCKAHTFYASALWRAACRKSLIYTQRKQAAIAAGQTEAASEAAAQEAAVSEAGIDAAIARAEIALAILDQKPLSEEQRNSRLLAMLGTYYRIKGELLNQRSQPAEARRLFEKSLAILLRAREMDRWDNEASRQAGIRRGLRPDDLADVGDSMIYKELGIAQAQLGLWKDAEETFSYMRRLDPVDVSGALLLGAVCLHSGQLDRAAVYFTEVLVIDPDNQEAWDSLAQVYEALGMIPLPIVNQNGRPLLDARNPVVRRVVNDACASLFRLFVDTKSPEDAEKTRWAAVNTYGCPPELFAAPGGAAAR